MQEKKKSYLELYTTELVSLAETGKLDPVIGRDNEIARIIRILSRRSKNNPILIGEAGTGKTSIVEGLAQRIVRGDIPTNLKCSLYSLDMSLLVAGASYRGEFEERLKGLMKELQEKSEQGNQCILFIDEIHLVLGAGKGDGAMDAANIMKPELARPTSGLRVIGATTLNEYRQYMEKDSAFERRFQKVMVNEPSVVDTVSILRGLKDRYETHHGVRISDNALVVAATLAERYIQGRFQPDKSIDLVDEACANVRVQLDSQPEQIDILERRQLQLQIEEQALKKEKDSASKKRLKVIKESLKSLEMELLPLREQYEKEREGLLEIKHLQEKLDSCKLKMEKAKRERNLSLVADLQYYVMPELEEKLKQAKQEEEEKSSSYTTDNDEQKEHTNPTVLLQKNVDADQIYQVVSNSTGIPVAKLGQSQQDKVLTLSQTLHNRIMGQETAIEAVSQAILRSKAGLNRPNMPLGSFLFLGLTGCGKTEIAKALAHNLFDDEKHLVRIDMSEYMEAHSVSRMIGSPPGYVGHEDGGQLTEAIRRKPYSVVLFDEIEKAHPQVLNVLLQILDDGRLTDGQGRLVSFSNTVLIMTSNVGAQYLMQNENVIKNGGMTTEIEEQVLQCAKLHFKPEFLNRLDEQIVMQALTRDNLKGILRMQLKQISERLTDLDIKLHLSETAMDYIINEAYYPQYGARPLRRYLEKYIVTELGKMLIGGLLKERDCINIGCYYSRSSSDNNNSMDDTEETDEMLTMVGEGKRHHSEKFTFNIVNKRIKQEEEEEEDQTTANSYVK